MADNRHLILLSLIAVITYPHTTYCTFNIEDYINPEDLKYIVENWNLTYAAFPDYFIFISYHANVEEYINPEDLKYLAERWNETYAMFPDDDDDDDDANTRSINREDIQNKNMTIRPRPKRSSELNVEFYFSNREIRKTGRMQVVHCDQNIIDWVRFNSTNPTILIVHGFLSYSKASWVLNMTEAFLDWGDVNVITVHWSRGGRIWKYWKAVAYTRTAGTDIARFLEQLINATGANIKDFHFVGDNLGAHICSFASNRLGGVRRITGLDPAQPCFTTTELAHLLDKSDADFVDVIHTNGRKLTKLGLGIPKACGHQDFYPNGGMI
ncbi:pancreatic triacylglycerol lipase-like [Arctopsyche grandis]|uniref:pancreatic triacylglycerol lipase-like n=1 Tax=Arctopsyche grandis TaxID=121162 RepID=UPI00406D8950